MRWQGYKPAHLAFSASQPRLLGELLFAGRSNTIQLSCRRSAFSPTMGTTTLHRPTSTSRAGRGRCPCPCPCRHRVHVPWGPSTTQHHQVAPRAELLQRLYPPHNWTPLGSPSTALLVWKHSHNQALLLGAGQLKTQEKTPRLLFRDIIFISNWIFLLCALSVSWK